MLVAVARGPFRDMESNGRMDRSPVELLKPFSVRFNCYSNHDQQHPEIQPRFQGVGAAVKGLE
jgi:hypothetical protein